MSITMIKTTLYHALVIAMPIFQTTLYHAILIIIAMVTYVEVEDNLVRLFVQV